MKSDADYIFVLKGSRKSLFIVNIFATVIGGMLLYYWLQARMSAGVNAFLISYAVLISWMLADALYWIYNGIQEIRIGEDFFEIVRGKKQKVKRYHSTEITDLHFDNRMTRRSFQILLGNKVSSIPGIFTFYPGPKVWLTSDAFNDAEFDLMCDYIEKMFQKAQDLN